MQGMAAQTAARGHAEMGEHPEDEPPWMYFYDDGWFDMQRGMAELAPDQPAVRLSLLMF
ncbi:hypothetical protein GCM10009734_44720 [Nonomuraea bangladeshensis]